jgi:transposase-like protein
MTKTHARTPETRQRRRYTEQDKIRAVTIVIANGGMTYEAMEQVRQLLNNNKLSYTCLHQWVKRYRDDIKRARPDLLPPSLDTTVNEMRNHLLTTMTQAVVKYADHVNDDKVVAETKGRDAGVVMGILVDKLEALTGVTPEEAIIIRKFRMLATRSGYDHLEYMQDAYKAWEDNIARLTGATTLQITADTVDG